MRLKRTSYILGICVITWATVTYYALLSRVVYVSEPSQDVSNKLEKLESSISLQFKLNNEIINDAQKYLEIKKSSGVTVGNSASPQQKKEYKGTVIPVLVFACNRVSVSRCLDQLIQYRPNPDQFPIIVSQVSRLFYFFTSSVYAGYTDAFDTMLDVSLIKICSCKL